MQEQLCFENWDQTSQFFISKIIPTALLTGKNGSIQYIDAEWDVDFRQFILTINIDALMFWSVGWMEN